MKHNTNNIISNKELSKRKRMNRYMSRTIKKEFNDSIMYRKKYNTLQKELTYYKDYSMSAYCWNSELMEHINNLTMTKTE